jgi:hypothetical protein
METPKPPEFSQIHQTKKKPVKIWSNPPEIHQKLRARQKYFLPARQLSNLPEFPKSGGENRHLATLAASILLV